MFTNDSKDIKKADFIIVTVPTPINNYNKPDLNPLISETEVIAQNLKL